VRGAFLDERCHEHLDVLAGRCSSLWSASLRLRGTLRSSTPRASGCGSSTPTCSRPSASGRSSLPACERRRGSEFRSKQWRNYPAPERNASGFPALGLPWPGGAKVRVEGPKGRGPKRPSGPLGSRPWSRLLERYPPTSRVLRESCPKHPIRCHAPLPLWLGTRWRASRRSGPSARSFPWRAAGRLNVRPHDLVHSCQFVWYPKVPHVPGPVTSSGLVVPG
jgi:hypothetical protein